MTELAQLQASAEQAAALLKSMSHPKRLLILCMLSGSPGTSAGELTRMLRLVGRSFSAGRVAGNYRHTVRSENARKDKAGT